MCIRHRSIAQVGLILICLLLLLHDLAAKYFMALGRHHELVWASYLHHVLVFSAPIHNRLRQRLVGGRGRLLHLLDCLIDVVLTLRREN